MPRAYRTNVALCTSSVRTPDTILPYSLECLVFEHFSDRIHISKFQHFDREEEIPNDMQFPGIARKCSDSLEIGLQFRASKGTRQSYSVRSLFTGALSYRYTDDWKVTEQVKPKTEHLTGFRTGSRGFRGKSVSHFTNRSDAGKAEKTTY